MRERETETDREKALTLERESTVDRLDRFASTLSTHNNGQQQQIIILNSDGFHSAITLIAAHTIQCGVVHPTNSACQL